MSGLYYMAEPGALQVPEMSSAESAYCALSAEHEYDRMVCTYGGGYDS